VPTGATIYVQNGNLPANSPDFDFRIDVTALTSYGLGPDELIARVTPATRPDRAACPAKVGNDVAISTAGSRSRRPATGQDRARHRDPVIVHRSHQAAPSTPRRPPDGP